MEKNVFSWQFGTCNFIDVYKNNTICVHFEYNSRRKIKVAWSTTQISKNDWEQALSCVKEAKEILKKVNKI